MSSSLCEACGAAERAQREDTERTEREAYEASAFGQFMSQPEDERWRMLFDRLEALE
ncbi:hypothetical protein [Bosea sp. LjRoot237]|uniref:hypothetical protein n=1 Tax=Bosea sp. LjRoot237 TaxID=3342292 RepID=UPI003ECD1814